MQAESCLVQIHPMGNVREGQDLRQLKDGGVSEPDK